MNTVQLLAQAAVDPGLPGGPTPGGAEAVAFWILGPIALAGALGMVFARNAVHSALCLAGTMLSLGFLYMGQGALFLGFVQIIVYTGAVMMLFLFVLMLVGRDSSDSVVEVLRGQRSAALLFGVGLAVLLVGAVGNAFTDVTPAGLDAGGANWNGNVPGLGEPLVGLSSEPLLGSRPRYTATLPPFRPDVQCISQQPPNLAAETGP